MRMHDLLLLLFIRLRRQYWQKRLRSPSLGMFHLLNLKCRIQTSEVFQSPKKFYFEELVHHSYIAKKPKKTPIISIPFSTCSILDFDNQMKKEQKRKNKNKLLEFENATICSLVWNVIYHETALTKANNSYIGIPL